MPELLSLNNLSNFSKQIRQDQEAIEGRRAKYYTRAPVNILNLEEMLTWQTAVRNALVRQSEAVSLDPTLAKYSISREEIDKFLLTERELQEIIRYRNQYRIVPSEGRERPSDRPFYFRSEAELRQFLQNEMNLPQGKINLFMTWAFSETRDFEHPNYQYFEARRLLYEYLSNQVVSGNAPFTKNQLLKDFEDVAASYGHIKSVVTEQRQVYATLQKILERELDLDLDKPEDQRRAQEIQKNAKIYYKQQRRYYPETTYDPAIQALERKIAKEKERLEAIAESEELTEEEQQEMIKLAQKINKYETELAKLLDAKAQGISVPGLNVKVRDMSFDRFLRLKQQEIMDLTTQYQNGLLSESVWKSELKRLFQHEIYLYGIIQQGGIRNIDWERMDKLAWHLKSEMRRLNGFVQFISGSPEHKTDLLNYVLSIPIKIILDDINLSLLSQIPYESLAAVLNSQFREIGSEALAYLRGKNSDYFDYLARLPAELSLNLASKTATNWLQGQVNSYIFSLEDSARRLRASKDWLRYTWDPILQRYIARAPIGISPRQMLTMLRDNPTRFMVIMYGKTNEEDLTLQQHQQLAQFRSLLQEYIDANRLGLTDLAGSKVAEFEKLITQEQLERINPGINRIDPNTGQRFFIGKFYKANQLLSDEDTITFNRLLLLERKLDLERSGKYGLAAQLQSISEWELATVKRLKKYHILSYALGSGLNPTQFKQRDYNRLIETLTTQYQYLRDLVFDILNDSQLSESRFLMRLLQHAANTAISYYIGQLENHIRSGFKRARRILASDEPCPGCVEEASKGWVPIDFIAPIGSIAPCFSNCRCRIEYDR